jgi:hypothetical protein
MVSFTRKFVSIGNRRDKNLSDITDQKQSLTNVLDTIIGDGTFVADDLEFLNGLEVEYINSGYLTRLANTTVKTIQDGTEVTATPLVTIKDRVENAKDITGKIPPNIGGLGLSARFIESTEVNVGNTNSTGADIFVLNNQQVIDPNYWEYGLFQHQNLFDPSFKNEYGGIQWTGYFSPYASAPSSTITVSTTGLLLIEYDLNESNIWTKVVNLYAQTRPIIPTSSGTSTVIPINSALSSHLSICGGDKLVTNNQITVTGVSATQITLSNPITFVLNQPVSFTTIIGEDVKEKSFTLPTVEPGEEYVKLRISYWFPNNNIPINQKYLYFVYLNSTLPFQYLYSELPVNPPGPNEYRTFIESALSPYNNTLGNFGVLGSNYKNLTIKRTYINEYVPKNSLAGISPVQNISLSFTNNSSVGRFNSSIENANVGNYIVARSAAGTQLPKYLQIKTKLNDTQVAFKDKIIAVSGSKTVDVIDHKGFINWFYANSVGANVTVDSTTGLTINNIVVTNSTSSFVRVTSIINATSFATSTNLGLTALQPIYIYSERGITDNSKTNFCAGVFGVTLASQAAVGNTLNVSSNAGIIIGQVVQHDAIPAATTVTGISGTTVNLSANTLFITPINSTITFTPAGTTLNKEICVIPFDTAPPFEGTTAGLKTVGRGLKSTAVANFQVVSNDLTIITNASNITNVTSTATYNRKLAIKNSVDSNTYYVFSTNTA